MDDVLFVLVTLLLFGLGALIVGVLDRRLDDRTGGERR